MNRQSFLLDSNIVVWINTEPERLTDYVVEQLRFAPKVFLSAVSAWELTIKQARGHLTLENPISEMLREHVLTELPITIQHGEAVQDLPLHHRDPFDRLLLAQAKVEGLVLVTSDKFLLRYAVPILSV